MKVNRYLELNVDNIAITKPIKIGGVYTSNVLYNDSPLYFQTPLMTFKSGDKVSCKVSKYPEFCQLMKNIREKIISILHSNSVNFFKGVQYDLDRLQRSVKDLVTVEGDYINFLNTEIDPDNLKVFSSSGEQTTLPPFPYDSVCIMKLDSIVYRTDIKTNIKINYVKLKNKKLEDCVLGDEDDFYFA